MKLNEWVNNYIKEVTHSHEYEDMSQMGEDENDPQEISVGNYQTKYFHVCPGASKLYGDIESKGVDMDMAERSARLQDALYFVEEHIQRDGYKPERDYVMVAKNIAKNIMKMAKLMGLEKEHDYIQGHVDTIEKVVKEKGLEERVMKLTEENVPTNPSKWSYYKSQAKKKFDVYPSAYANAWAAKQYKAAGGGWRTKKSEATSTEEDEFHKKLDKLVHSTFGKSSDEKKNEGMVEPRRGHKYYQLIKDAPVKYIESQSNPTGATGVLLHNKDGYLKGKKGAYVIDYYGEHFYVDLKSKFATSIYELRDQRELVKYIQPVGMAPEYNDWKKYVRESVNEGRVEKEVLQKISKFESLLGYITNDDQYKPLVSKVKKEIDKLKKQIKKNESVNEAKDMTFVDYLKVLDDKFLDAMKAVRGDNGSDAQIKPTRGDILQNFTLFRNYLSALTKKYKGDKTKLRFLTERTNRLNEIIKSVNEAQKVNPTSKKFLKGMKKIKVNGLGGYMPGVNYVYVDGDKYYFVDFEGDHMELKNTNTIKQLHKLHGKSLGESVNEGKDKVFVVMYKVKKDLPNRNVKPSSAAYTKEVDAKKFLKSVEKDGGKGMVVKSNKPVGVKVNEGIEPQIKKIAYYTGTRPEAVEDFVSKHGLNITKLLKFVEKGKLPERMAIVSALAGRPGNPVQKKIIKQFSESINEDYYKSASDAADAARKDAEKKGFEIDEDDWQTQIAMGGKHNRLRPGVGKTHSFSVGLTKNGKPQRKALNISLYGMDSGKFELTSYIN
jgi:hypothetical protein